MCGIKKNCSCGCSIKNKLKEAPYDKKITVYVNDPENTISELLNTIKTIGNSGHGFDIIVDPELKPENDEDGIKTQFYWDGDGSDHIKEIEVEEIDDAAVHEDEVPEEIPAYLTPGVNEGMSREDKEAWKKGMDKDFERVERELQIEAKKTSIDKDREEVAKLFVKYYKLNAKLTKMTDGKFMGFNKQETDLNKEVQTLKNSAWDLARKKNFDTNEIMKIDKEAKMKADGKKKMTESEEADYYENFAKQLRNNGEKHGEQIMLGKAAAAREGKLVDGEIVEVKNLNEASKVNLKLSSNSKRDLIRKAKTALDAIYQIYDICERLGIDNSKFIDWIDEAFEGTNEALTILVTQESIEKK